MNDPWHEESLKALVSYLQAVRRGTRAVVVTSGDRLREEVEHGLRDLLGKAHTIVEIHLVEDVEPETQLASALRETPVSGRVTLVKGLPKITESQRSAEGVEIPAIFPYLNLNRELFDRSGEAFVFFLDSDTAKILTSEAPDFNRYTSWFEFIEWDDVVSLAGMDADRAAAERQNWQRRETEAARLVNDLREQPAEPGDLATALLSQAVSLQILSKPRETLSVANEALEAATRAEDASLECRILSRISSTQLDLGNSEHAKELARRSMDAAQRSGETQEKALAHSVFCHALRDSGHNSEALVESEAALRLYRSVNDHDGGAVAAASRALSFLELGMTSEASQLAATALSESRLATSVSAECNAWYVVAAVEYMRGDLGKAARSLGRALVLASSSAYERGRLYILALFGRFEICAGRLARGRQLLAEVLSAGQESKSFRINAAVTNPLVLAMLAADDLTGARALNENTLAETRAAGFRVAATQAVLGRGKVLEAERNPDGAIGSIEAALRDFQEMGQLLEVAEAKANLARLFRLRGEPDLAAPLARSALDLNREAGARPAEARALTELAFLARQQGDAEAARRYAQEALAILRETGARFDEPAALAALGCAYDGAGRSDLAEPIRRRWRRLVDGMEAPGLRKWIERSVEAFSQEREAG